MQISPTRIKPSLKAPSIQKQTIKAEQFHLADQNLSEWLPMPEIGPKDLYSTVKDDFSKICYRKDCLDLSREVDRNTQRTGDEDRKPYEIAFIHNYACKRAKEMVPGSSPYQITRIAKRWPALAKVVTIAENSAAYLKNLERDKKPCLLAPKQEPSIFYRDFRPGSNQHFIIT